MRRTVSVSLEEADVDFIDSVRGPTARSRVVEIAVALLRSELRGAPLAAVQEAGHA